MEPGLPDQLPGALALLHHDQPIDYIFIREPESKKACYPFANLQRTVCL
jgi:hypothetical protein